MPLTALMRAHSRVARNALRRREGPLREIASELLQQHAQLITRKPRWEERLEISLKSCRKVGRDEGCMAWTNRLADPPEWTCSSDRQCRTSETCGTQQPQNLLVLYEVSAASRFHRQAKPYSAGS